MRDAGSLIMDWGLSGLSRGTSRCPDFQMSDLSRCSHSQGSFSKSLALLKFSVNPIAKDERLLERGLFGTNLIVVDFLAMLKSFLTFSTRLIPIEYI